MIRSEDAMTSPAPTTTPAQPPLGSKIAILLGVGTAVGLFFYFDLGQFLSLEAFRKINADKEENVR